MASSSHYILYDSLIKVADVGLYEGHRNIARRVLPSRKMVPAPVNNIAAFLIFSRSKHIILLWTSRETYCTLATIMQLTCRNT